MASSQQITAALKAGSLKLCSAARQSGAKAIVIGGHALVLHGNPRHTGDLDINMSAVDWMGSDDGLKPLTGAPASDSQVPSWYLRLPSRKSSNAPVLLTYTHAPKVSVSCDVRVIDAQQMELFWKHSEEKDGVIIANLPLLLMLKIKSMRARNEVSGEKILKDAGDINFLASKMIEKKLTMPEDLSNCLTVEILQGLREKMKRWIEHSEIAVIEDWLKEIGLDADATK